MTFSFTNRKNAYASLILCFIVAYFIALSIPLLQNNLWNDEIYTLKKFTLVTVKQTLTDYHVPNNHILYNLFDNIYLKIIGIDNLKAAFERPSMLRLPLLFVSAIIILFTYRAGKLAGGIATGLLSALLLVTAVPFQNFSLQVRGYTFSTLFDLCFIFYTLRYIFNSKREYLLLIALSAWATMYTIPSNLYCIIGVIGFLTIEILAERVAGGIIEKKYLWLTLAIILGVLLALCCYIPVLNQVFNNDYVRGETSDDKIIVAQLLLLALNEFVLSKEFFFYATIVFIATLFLLLAWHNTSHHAMAMKILFFQFITPALMVLVRGEQPPARIFAYLIPPVTVFAAVIIVYVIRHMLSKRYQYVIGCLLPVYILVVHRVELCALKTEMDFNLKNETRTQGMYYHYYLYNYHPLAQTKYLLKNTDAGNIPVVYKDSEPNDMTDYFNAFNLRYYPLDSLDYLLSQKKVAYIVTRYPSQLDSTFAHEHNCIVQEVSRPSYNHIIKVARF